VAVIIDSKQDRKPMMKYDLFTERAQDAANRSIEILQRYGHNVIDIEHFLLALLEQSDGAASRILGNLNIDTSTMHVKLEAYLRGVPKAAIDSDGKDKVFITPRVKRVLSWPKKKPNDWMMSIFRPSTFS
jgi:ATP-dependent Clp protease ATP-binding subunit ClpC